MSIREMFWHFITHFSIAFTAAVIIALIINVVANGVVDLNNWAIPFGVGLIGGIVTTLMQTRNASPEA